MESDRQAREPRCAYGYGYAKCQRRIDHEDTLQLGLCDFHTQQARITLNAQLVDARDKGIKRYALPD